MTIFTWANFVNEFFDLATPERKQILGMGNKPWSTLLVHKIQSPCHVKTSGQAEAQTEIGVSGFVQSWRVQHEHFSCPTPYDCKY